jgi:hypothetical protein
VKSLYTMGFELRKDMKFFINVYRKAWRVFSFCDQQQKAQIKIFSSFQRKNCFSASCVVTAKRGMFVVVIGTGYGY